MESDVTMDDEDEDDGLEERMEGLIVCSQQNNHMRTDLYNPSQNCTTIPIPRHPIGRNYSVQKFTLIPEKNYDQNTTPDSIV